MARKKNATFAGVSVFDTDVNAPTFKRAIADTVGDVALIHDKVTGANAHDSGDTINHSGGDRGCPLGVPLVNQYIGRALTLTDPSTKGNNGGVGDTIIAPMIVYLPSGEDTITVDVFVDHTFNAGSGADDPSRTQPHLEVLECAAGMASEADVPMTLTALAANGGNSLYTARVSGLAAGPHIVFPCLNTESLEIDPTVSLPNFGILNSVCVHFGRLGVDTSAPVNEETAYGVTTPAATEGVAHTSFDSSLFADLSAIDGYTLSRLNRNLNGLQEYVSGWPAYGNSSYTHVDHDGAGAADASDPARPRFEGHTQALYTSEARIIFPVASWTFGAHLRSGKWIVDLAEPPTIGCLDFFPPWPEDGTERNVVYCPINIPDFPTASSGLNMYVLLGSDGDSEVGQWTVKCQTTTGTSAGVTPVEISSGANDFWLATVTSIPFTGDADERIAIRMSRSAVGTESVGEVNILAACLVFTV